MKRSPLTILVAFLLIVIFGAMLFIYTVRQSEVAVVTVWDRLAANGVETNPGPHGRWPWPIEKVYKLDQRIHSLEDNSEQLLLPDQYTVLLTTFTGWRISDPATFFKTFPDGSTVEAENKLKSIISSAKLEVAGKHKFSDFISADPAQIKLNQIEDDILTTARQKVSTAGYGLEIVFVQIKNMELPTTVSQNVFNRMRDDRNKRAAVITSDATAQSETIKADADSQASKIVAEADARAKAIRGEGELQMVRSLEVMNQNPDFAKFLLDLDMIQEMGKSQATFILGPETKGMGPLLQNPTSPGSSNHPSAAMPPGER